MSAGYLAMWPTLHSGLDSHHDGLVITTINSTKEALLRGGEPPFNQYGPFWSVSYSVLTLPFNSESTLIVSRFITLTIYFLTAYCLYKTAQRLNTPGLWPLVIALLLLTQPWTTGFGTTFLAWPSALSSFLLSLITYQIVCSLEKPLSGRESVIIGLVTCCLIFTRLQIGVAAFLLTVVFFTITRRGKDFYLFLISFLISLSISVSFLLAKNWFDEFLFDSVLFPLTYVQDEYSVNPVPIFTLSIALFAFIFLIIYERRTVITESRQVKSIPAYFYIALAVLTLLIVLAVLVLPEFQDFSIRAVRRFWIGGFLGCALFAIKKNILRANQGDLRRASRMQIWLLLYGAVGMVQLFPLFDQVHFWWGLAPLVIPIAVLILEETRNWGLDRRKFIFACLISIGVITTIIPSAQRAMVHEEIYVQGLVNLVRVSPESNLDQRNLQAYFSRSIDKGSRVLNLCHNSDVFFDIHLAKSSSRYFVYWPPFTKISKINSDLQNSNPDTIVTCSQTQVPLASQATNDAQLKIINHFGFTEVQSKQILLNGTVWKIYRK